jgi:hypothetical protein
MRDVPIFGGMTEQVEDREDPAYQRQYRAWLLKIRDHQIRVIALGVKVIDPEDWQEHPDFVDLCRLNVTDGSLGSFLRFVALQDEQDAERVLLDLMYHSTTTERGVQEALNTYDATWANVPVMRLRVPRLPCSYSSVFEAREAARFGQMAWSEFCDLPGPQQSAILAHYRVSMRIQALSAQSH